MANSPESVDLQLLVASYIDIVKNAGPVPMQGGPVLVGTFAAPAPITPSPAVATPPPTSGTRPAVLPASASSSMAATPAAIVTPKPPTSRAVVPAATIRQDLPAYVSSNKARPTSGAVRVTIGPDGKVTKAVMEVPIDPRYDARVLAAARSWSYKPATVGGDPIQSDKIVHINIGK